MKLIKITILVLNHMIKKNGNFVINAKTLLNILETVIKYKETQDIIEEMEDNMSGYDPYWD